MITFLPYGRRVEARRGEKILEAALEAGIRIRSLCGGRGLCGRCRVIVRDGGENLSPPSETEKRTLSKDELSEGFRLACQTEIASLGDIVVEIPFESQPYKQRLLTGGLERPVQLKPAVRRVVVKVRKPTLKNVESDVDLLLEALEREVGNRPRVGYEALKRVPSAIREGEWTVSVVLWMDREIISIEPGRPRKGLYGLAVDVGTTKLAAFLVDLESGETVATASDMNPQISYGEDVISRISYTLEGEGHLEKLRRAVTEGINRLLREACEAAGVEPSMVYDMTVVGNTAMHHIFLGIPPRYVSLSPYPPVVRSPVDVKAKELGVELNVGAYVHALPVIAGFVGADAVADILATGIHEEEATSLLIDIGTNTEIVLGCRDELTACSCASGPAFEGAHITHGMRAVEGAIERIWIDPETLEPVYKTIGDVEPRGICGSAIIDAAAEMLKAGIIGADGTFKRDLEAPNIRREGGTVEFVVAPKEETSTGKDIVITQSDLREVQLAKAAIYTGTSILMRRMGIKPRDIEKAFIAGAFGNYVDPENAQIIGMYPEIPLERVRFVGNTAGSGARMALLSTDVRRLAAEVVRRVRYLELGADPDFQSEFLKATHLPHMEPERFPNVMRILKKVRKADLRKRA